MYPLYVLYFTRAWGFSAAVNRSLYDYFCIKSTFLRPKLKKKVVLFIVLNAFVKEITFT